MAVRLTLKPRSDAGGTDVPAGIVSVVLIYAVFSALWVVVSDKAVELLFDDPAYITLAGTLKGWLFVLVTSVLLYGLMRRVMISNAGENRFPDAGHRPILFPLLLLIAAITLMTAGEIAHTVIDQKDREGAILHTVAELKTMQLTDWLGERHADARFVQISTWIDIYRNWRESGDAVSLEQLQERLLRFRKNNSFQGILLVSEQGELLWDSESTETVLDPELVPHVREATTSSEIICLGPYAGVNGRLHIDFIVPLTGEGVSRHPVVILHIDPQDYLIPSLQSWPIPSATGETLLVLRDDSRVFRLEEQAAGVKTGGGQIVHEEEQSIAAKIRRGQIGAGGLIEGVDLQGVPIIGVVQAVPDTDWFIVAKLDKKDFYEKIFHNVFWIALTGVLALFMGVAGILIFRQRQELAASLRLREIQADRLRVLALLDSIVQSSRDVVFAKDTRGRYLLFNREAERVTGRKAEEVLGRDDTAVFPPDEAGKLRANDLKVVADDRTMSIEESVTSAADGRLTFLATKGPLHDAEGRLIGLFGIARDITERKKIEDDLRESEARHHSTVTALTEGVIVFDTNGLVLSCNPSAERILRLTEKEMINRRNGLADWQPVREDGSPFPVDELPVSRTLATEQPRRGVVLGDINPEGKLAWLLVNSEPVHDETDGRLVAVVVSFTDITERKQAEEALKDSEEFKHAILDSMSSSIAVVNPGGIIVAVNETWRRFALENGSEPDREAPRTRVGINYLDICRESSGISSAEAMRAMEGIQAVLDGRLPSFSLEYPCHSPDRERWFGMTVTPLGAAGKGAVIAHGDITDRKRIEEDLRQSLEEKVALLKEVHHRVKNNLQIVASLLNLQTNRTPDPHVAEILQDTRNRVRSIALLHELLYSSGNLARINFSVYVHELCTQLLLSFGRAAVRVRVEERVAAVGLPLEQAVPCGLIISELVANALKHGFPNGREGVVAVEFDYDEEQHLRLRVRDNGVGLAPGFDPAGATTLGLQLVVNLAGQLGGKMVVVSPPEGGAVFKVFFPGISKEIVSGGKV